MRNSAFARFKEIVKTCNDTDPIWHQGYLWLDLTVKQSNTIYDILVNRGCEINDRGYVLTPSGLGIKYIAE